ncbi:MAG: SRPBCC family protein [Rhodobacterales bacterium]|nr:SRPBCC family protein [Rhodobacterales bacterium]
MKLIAKTDLEAPAAFVYAQLADHAAWEREALRRGAEIERPADLPLSGVGAGWQIQIPFRGKLRKVLLKVAQMDPDQSLAYSFDGQSLQGLALLEVQALSARRSRLRVTLDAKPKTLAARLFINTLRLAKGRVQARFDKRLGQLAARIESSHVEARARATRT